MINNLGLQEYNITKKISNLLKKATDKNNDFYFLYPRWESNPNLKFRKLPFYPLNYKGIFFRFLFQVTKVALFPIFFYTAFVFFLSHTASSSQSSGQSVSAT